MTGAEYIAEFLSRHGCDKVFLLTGGACAFIVDAIARNPKVDYYCFAHEQAAAMAADATWRVSRNVGVTMATSGPGATNLLTGIACSYFDSIPSIHITGQVNLGESAAHLGVRVRQAGFQEANIVDIARPITKYAVQVRSGDELRHELFKAYEIATTARMGPVLIDVPMNVQQEEVGAHIDAVPPAAGDTGLDQEEAEILANNLTSFLRGSERPCVLFGAGVSLAGVELEAAKWLEENRIPFVSSWNALSSFRHDATNFCGQVGVYGNRGGNYIVQNCDALLVLGSRLDNRQRSGNTKNFAPDAKVMVFDVDEEELKKYEADGYETRCLDLVHLPEILSRTEFSGVAGIWTEYAAGMKANYFNKDISTYASRHNTLSPYAVVRQINGLIDEEAIVVADCGANLCWVYQSFFRTAQNLFTAGGNSPMGYSLPAAIGAAIEAPNRQIVCFIGDGGLLLNSQELQTLVEYDLNIVIVILNNGGYGIIRQFQDNYMDSRHEASGKGVGLADFSALVGAYGIDYVRVESVDALTPELFDRRKAVVIDTILGEGTLIEPKLEMGRPINDQFPYVDDAAFEAENQFVTFSRTR